VSAEQVAVIPRRAECDALWLPVEEEHWLDYLTDHDEIVFYCPSRAGREFGSD
jgi:hypothetical protein